MGRMAPSPPAGRCSMESTCSGDLVQLWRDAKRASAQLSSIELPACPLEFYPAARGGRLGLGLLSRLFLGLIRDLGHLRLFVGDFDSILCDRDGRIVGVLDQVFELSLGEGRHGARAAAL